MTDIRSERWVFTKNNPTPQWEDIALRFLNGDKVLTAVAEREHLTEGTPHIQGYFTTDKIYHRSVVALWLPECYLDKARGGWKQNWLYCTKEGPDNLFIERGHKLTELDQQKRQQENFAMLYDKMLTMTPAQFEEEFPQFMFYNRPKVLAVMNAHADTQQVWDGDLRKKNFWVWGKTGTGKTCWAYKQAEGHHLFRKAVSKWWSGYDRFRHDIVIVDEWPAVNAGQERLSDAMCNHLKNWSDRYSFEGELKGGHVVIQPGSYILVITSQYPIDECFTNGEDIMALKRRFHQVEFKFIKNPENGSMQTAVCDERGDLIEELLTVDWSVINK